MKQIIFFLIFSAFSLAAWAQYPTHPTKQELGRQTTGDGLTFRGNGTPSYTPSSKNNAWMFLDTISGSLYAYRGGSWQLVTAGGVTSVTISNDTLYVVTSDSTYTAVIDDADTNFANTNLTFSGNRVHNLSTRTLTIADGGTYPTFQQSSATDGISLYSSASDYIYTTPGLVELGSAGRLNVAATDTATITAGRIRLNAADTRVQQVPNDNALNRLVALDSLTGRMYYVDKSSISGGGGGGVTGTGTTGTIPVWSSSTALGDSPLTVSSGNVTATGTGAFRLPNGTTAQRPGTPTAGMSRYNTSLGYSETYGASAWLQSDFPSGLDKQTLRHDGTSWVASSVLRQTATLASFNSSTEEADFTIKQVAANAAPVVKIGGDYTNTGGYRSMGASESAKYAMPTLAVVQPNGTYSNIPVPSSYSQATMFNLQVLPGASGQNHIANYTLALSTGAMTTTSPTLTGLYALSTATATATRTTGVPNFVAIDSYANRGASTLDAGTFIAGRFTAAATAGSTATAGYFSTSGAGTRWGIWSNSGDNVLIGNTMIGTGSAASRTLHVSGETRITDLTTDTPTRIVGADADGDLGSITVGSGLSLSSGTLTATGTGTNLAFSGASSPVTLTSDTGTDVIFAAGSGLALSQSGGTATYSRTYSLIHTTITGGSTFFGTTAERPDNDTPGSATTSAVGSDFSVSGSTIDYTGAGGALLRVEGSISFSVADDGDYYLSLYKEGTELGATSMRVSCVAGDYYSISLPATTTSGSTNDTFDLRIATVSGNSTTTMHRYGFIIERIY